VTIPGDRSYLERVAALDFNGVAWTREKILEVRDFLAPLLLHRVRPLYHLDNPYAFLEKVAGLCDGFAVIDTHVALAAQPETIKSGWRPELSGMRTFVFGGRQYEGRLFREFPPGTTRDVKDVSPTASLDNELSLWLTEDSLVQMLHDLGFSGTEKVVFPRDAGTW